MTKNKITDRRKVCYILSYRAPNYVRTATLVAALRDIPDIELTIIKNSSKGPIRYIQTVYRLIKYRLHNRAEVYLLGFRSHELFWLIYPFIRKSDIIFDEFINYRDWFVNEHRKAGKATGMIASTMDVYMNWVVRRCRYVLEDTPSHARLSAQMYRLPREKFIAIPVGAEERLFTPQSSPNSNQNLELFFYGNLIPLHGMSVILAALKKLKSTKDIRNVHTTLVGGKGKGDSVKEIKSFLIEHELEKNVTYLPWVEYEKLPSYMSAADVNLGGPFGDTGQGKRVVTGKTYQSLAMAKPTIVGRGENDSLFEDKVNAILVDQGSADALAKAIIWCKNHKNELPKIGAQGYSLYLNKFSTQELSRLLKRLLANRPA